MNTTQDPAGSRLAPTTGSAIFAEIAAEVERATAKFPTWPTDALHAVGVVAEEMGELQKEVMQLTYEPHKSTPETVRKEAVQLAAMSLRFLMSLDRYAYEPRPQHSQNDPKLSDGGAWQPGCGDTAGGEGGGSSRDDTRSRSLERMVRPLVLLEEHGTEGVEWAVSFDGGNPPDELCVRCTNRDEAVKLKRLVEERITNEHPNL